MMMLQINRIKIEIKDRILYEDLSFTLHKGERAGLVGRNGCGKTSLLKAIIGEREVDLGNIKHFGRVGYLPQDLDMPKTATVQDYLSQWEHEPEYYRILSDFKLWPLSMHSPKVLSGGEKTRVLMAGLLLDRNDLLILDEPTNHLDQEGIQKLEDYLSHYGGTVLLISHDRHFLDKTVNKILQLDEGKLRAFTGNYSDYRKQLDEERAHHEIQYDKYVQKKQQLELAARKQMIRANRYNDLSQNDFQRGKSKGVAKKAKALEKRVSMLEEVEKPKVKPRISLYMSDAQQVAAKHLVIAEGIGIGFDGRKIFDGVSFQIGAGERIGLMGSNGSGKSTLLKGLLGEILLEGKLWISQTARVGYFSQEMTALDPEDTPLGALACLNMPENDLRRFLGTLFFKSEDVHKKISMLSYGEKSRVAFLKLALGGYNLLLLDEPTNFLDIPTREKIEELLEDFQGTILFVSHDRTFTQKMANRLWTMAGGQLEVGY